MSDCFGTWKKGTLLVYSLVEPLRDPGGVFTPRLKAIFELPNNELRQELSHTFFLCDAPSRTMSVGHFYPDAADVMLSIVIYLINYRGALDLHIPARQLLLQVLTVSEAESRGTAPVVIPWTMWREAVLVDARRRWESDGFLTGLPLAFVARSVQAIAKPCSHPHLHSTNPSSVQSANKRGREWK